MSGQLLKEIEQGNIHSCCDCLNVWKEQCVPAGEWGSRLEVGRKRMCGTCGASLTNRHKTPNWGSCLSLFLTPKGLCYEYWMFLSSFTKPSRAQTEIKYLLLKGFILWAVHGISIQPFKINDLIILLRRIIKYCLLTWAASGAGILYVVYFVHLTCSSASHERDLLSSNQ